jgi:hypothetical protein
MGYAPQEPIIIIIIGLHLPAFPVLVSRITIYIYTTTHPTSLNPEGGRSMYLRNVGNSQIGMMRNTQSRIYIKRVTSYNQ